MQKQYISLGLMSGTSGDGVDASLIISDGISNYEAIKDKYFEYDEDIYKNIHILKEKIYSKQDLEKYSKEISSLERNITLFHAKVIKEMKIKQEQYLIGFHGQTIYHNSKEKISKQLGDARLLHQLIQKNIIYNFRKNDILNVRRCPLTPIFHQLLATQKKLTLPICILNIEEFQILQLLIKTGSDDFSGRDIGPGNCLIDKWVRKNSKQKYDLMDYLPQVVKQTQLY